MKKTALITGSSRGIGRAIAIELAKKGFDCIINCKENIEKAEEVVNEIRTLGVKAIYIKADISKYDEVSSMFDEIKRQFGRIDVLVNNAGIAIGGFFQDLSENDWNKVINTNVNGMFNCSQFAIKDMLTRHSGQIINISSIWGIVGCAMEVAYATSKGAVISFTKSLAKEVGYSNIRVNCIAPGAVDTDMLSVLPKEVLEQVVLETPAKRLGQPEDIAKLVSYLTSDEAEFITGEIINISGGYII